MSDTRTPRTPRTPRAEAALRRAQNETYRLADEPTACVELFKQRILPAISGATAAGALAEFESSMTNDQFRMEFVLWAYRGALRLYEAGALD
jgi:hypothetical protein